MIPEGEVPYTPNDAPVGTDHTRLEQEYRGFYRFVKGWTRSFAFAEARVYVRSTSRRSVC